MFLANYLLLHDSMRDSKNRFKEREMKCNEVVVSGEGDNLVSISKAAGTPNPVAPQACRSHNVRCVYTYLWVHISMVSNSSVPRVLDLIQEN